MFVPAPQVRYLNVPRERVVAVIQSINTPSIAVPGSEPEPTAAYVIGLRNLDDSFSVVVYLHRKACNRPAVYLSRPRDVALADYPRVEAAALQFTEEMGFIVDNLNFRRLPAHEQRAVMLRIPVFHEDLASFAEPYLEGPFDRRDHITEIDDLEPFDPLAASHAGAPAEPSEAHALRAALPVVEGSISDAAIELIRAEELRGEQRARLGRLLAAL